MWWEKKIKIWQKKFPPKIMNKVTEIFDFSHLCEILHKILGQS